MTVEGTTDLMKPLLYGLTVWLDVKVCFQHISASGSLSQFLIP